jgi:putative Holliday junction resolvase
MKNGVFLGFDYGFRRIGVAVGQMVTATARPLATVLASNGRPNWSDIDKLVRQWQPQALIIGFPTCIDGKEQYTTKAAKKFSNDLCERYGLDTHLVDERLTTVEARSRLFDKGGYRQIQQSQVDAVAAVLILEQWLQQ